MPHGIDRHFRLIPQLTFCCCCTNCSLRTGALLVGWLGLTIFAVPELILIILVGTVVKGKPFYVERICAVACVTLEIDVLTRSADLPPWLGLMDLTVAVACCSAVLIMSAILLIGMYDKQITLVKLWLEVVVPLWAAAVVYSSTRIILVFVFGHGNIWGDFVSSVIHIFVIPGVPLYCIVVVKSYYVEECRSLRDANGKRDAKTGKSRSGTNLGRFLQRIPEVNHTCCCSSYTLRLGVLTVGWSTIVGLAFYVLMIAVFILESVLTGNSDRIPEWSFYGETSYIAAWVDLSFNGTLVLVLLATSVTLLIGLNKGKLKIIKLLLGIHVIMWFASFMAQIMCYVATSMAFFPRFSIRVAFKIVIIHVVYAYWIVLIKSFYVVEYIRKNFGQGNDEVSPISAAVKMKSELILWNTPIEKNITDEDKTKELNRKHIGKEKTPLPGEQHDKDSKLVTDKKLKGSEKTQQETLARQEREKTMEPEKNEVVRVQSTNQLRDQQQAGTTMESDRKELGRMKSALQIRELPPKGTVVESDRKERTTKETPQKVQQQGRTMEPERKKTGSEKTSQQVQQRQQRERTVEPEKKQLGTEKTPQQVQQRQIRERTIEPEKKQSATEKTPQQLQSQQRERTFEPEKKQLATEKTPQQLQHNQQQVQQRQLREKMVETEKKQLATEKTPQQLQQTQQVQQRQQREKTVEPEKKQGKEKTPQPVREMQQQEKAIEPDKKETERAPKKMSKSHEETKKSQGREKSPHTERGS